VEHKDVLSAVLPLLNTEVEAKAGVSESEQRQRKRDLLAKVLLPRLLRRSKDKDAARHKKTAREEKVAEAAAAAAAAAGAAGAAAHGGAGRLIDLDALFESEGLGLGRAEGEGVDGDGLEKIERRQVELYMSLVRKDIEKELGPCPHDPSTAYDYRQDVENLKMVTAQIIKKQLRARRLVAARVRRRAGKWAGVGGAGSATAESGNGAALP